MSLGHRKHDGGDVVDTSPTSNVPPCSERSVPPNTLACTSAGCGCSPISFFYPSLSYYLPLHIESRRNSHIGSGMESSVSSPSGTRYASRPRELSYLKTNRLSLLLIMYLGWISTSFRMWLFDQTCSNHAVGSRRSN